MRYLIFLSDVETQQLRPGDPGFEERMAEYAAFDDMARQRGVWRDSGKLLPSTAAVTVRVRSGKSTCTDGPFAETKEQCGGFYILECTDLNQALELAAQIPTAKTGSVEVRPIRFLAE
jgi:hypothetical protein